ncbi:unnamed protein product [Peronospora belbahrii]|uniref:Vesicle tethering protein Uso1/P115-like head domain-containing protein n=1 Tax=Peronospora belbahrii TaxID=622444 RepID=A0AAU9KU41_9STRA|nr:unnamed protein product [Peronospora belbahrii]CAH0521528.1 unnamed protein product [Peronospora belbahrii]
MTSHSVKVKAELTVAVERLQFATLLVERKKAMSALQSFVQQLDIKILQERNERENTVEEQSLGPLIVPVILEALVSDPRDTELMETMLEFLQVLVSRAPSVAFFFLQLPPPPPHVATWGMETCLTLLEDPSPWIKGPTIGLVKALQDAQPSAFATSILECKEGLRRLLQVVEDRREHIRDTALVILGQLTGQEKNVQQFLAFEEGFVKLFHIMETEGFMETEEISDTSSVVFGDCLEIINKMLRDNLMTQTLFLEMPYMETHVSRILRVSGIHGGNMENDTVRFERRKRVVTLGLQLVRFLVAELYENTNEESLDEMAKRDRTRKSKDLARIQCLVARQEALMGAIGELVCCRSDALIDLRLQALDLLRRVSEHNGGAQMILVNLYASPSGRNVLAELMGLDVGIENNESPVAAAASTLLDELFEENEGARMAVLQHIQIQPPPPFERDDEGSSYESPSSSFSAGRVLLDAFVVNTDFITQCSKNSDVETLNSKLTMAWKASHRLTRLLTDSSYCKELALRLPAEYGDPQARAVAGGLFLSRCIRMLQIRLDEELDPDVQSIVFQANLSVLLLLIRWCHDCPKAVREIVGSVTNLSVLVDILSAKQSSSSSRSAAETKQLRGLGALLLGCCLEFLCGDEEEQALIAANTAVPAAVLEENLGSEMTRDQLLQMISKRVGLDCFTDALIQCQQTPAMLACARASATQSSRTLLTYRATYDTIDIVAAVKGPNGSDRAHYLFMLYERGFTIFYREMAEQIQKRIVAIYTGADNVSSSVDSGAPNGMGAYQDLIRMQDKQISDLQRQVKELKQCAVDEGSQNSDTLITNTSPDKALVEQLAAQREQLEREKAYMENRIRSMSESAHEMETRMNELAMAYVQLGAAHQQREKQELDDTSPVTECVQSSSVPYDTLQAQLTTLRAELDAEREASRRLRSEIASFKDVAATHVLGKESEADLASARLVKQLEEHDVESKRKDEELAKCKHMLETLTEDLALVKNDNERLKVQLAEALSRCGQVGEAERKDIVDGLIEAKARLEVRVEELEAAALAAYEKDQEVLRQRIHEVEQARRASSALLEIVLPSTDTPRKEESWEVNTVDRCLKEFASTRSDDVKELRAAVANIDSVAMVRESQVKQASFLAENDSQSRRDKDKYDTTLRELKEELARVLSEKKDAECKAKAEVKELEIEVARLRLKKELEKELGSRHSNEGFREVRNGTFSTLNGSSSGRSIEFENSKDSTLDDLLVLVASLEIQCSVLCEMLKEAQGEHAVAVAVELARQRGAVVLV